MPRLHAASIVGLVVSVKKTKTKTSSDTARLATDSIFDIALDCIGLYCIVLDYMGLSWIETRCNTCLNRLVFVTIWYSECFVYIGSVWVESAVRGLS